MSNGEFTWKGSLESTNIRALYERCQRLRLTGLMRLKQGEAVLDLMWVGGEPIEGEGDQGTRSLPLWNNGEFIVEQRMPDFKGQLSSSTEMSGPLRPGHAQAIYKLCADNVLSADVSLARGNGETAQVRFTLGKAETATINGQTESALQALSKLSSWVDGNFRVALRPLFTEGAAEAPVFKEQKAANKEQFDLTGSVNIDANDGKWPPELREAAGLPTPMDSSGNQKPVAPAAATPPATAAKPPAAAGSSSSEQKVPPRLAVTLLPSKDNAPSPIKPGALPPPASSSAPTVPMTSVPRSEIAALMRPTVPLKKGKTLQTVGIVAFLIVLLCAGLAVGFFVLGKR